MLLVLLIFNRCDGGVWTKDWSAFSWNYTSCKGFICKTGMLCPWKVRLFCFVWFFCFCFFKTGCFKKFLNLLWLFKHCFKVNYQIDFKRWAIVELSDWNLDKRVQYSENDWGCYFPLTADSLGIMRPIKVSTLQKNTCSCIRWWISR